MSKSRIETSAININLQEIHDEWEVINLVTSWKCKAERVDGITEDILKYGCGLCIEWPFENCICATE